MAITFTHCCKKCWKCGDFSNKGHRLLRGLDLLLNCWETPLLRSGGGRWFKGWNLGGRVGGSAPSSPLDPPWGSRGEEGFVGLPQGPWFGHFFLGAKRQSFLTPKSTLQKWVPQTPPPPWVGGGPPGLNKSLVEVSFWMISPSPLFLPTKGSEF